MFILDPDAELYFSFWFWNLSKNWHMSQWNVWHQYRAWNNFSGWRRSSCPVKPIFARTPPIFGRTNLHYAISLQNSPPPSAAWCLHIKQVHFLSLYCTWSLELIAGKVECMVQPQRSAKSILHLCKHLSLQFYVFYTVKC